MVYMYCFGYYVSCKASTITFPDNAALSDEFLVTCSPRAYPGDASMTDRLLVVLALAPSPGDEFLVSLVLGTSPARCCYA